MRIRKRIGIAMVACSVIAGAAHAQQKAPRKPAAPPPTVATVQEAHDQNVNRDALILVDFKQRIDKYMALHKQLARDSARIKETSDPAQISAAQKALAAKIQAARSDARAGDIFTPEIRDKFRRLMYPELKGSEGREIKKELKEDVEESDEGVQKKVPMKVNAPYPEGNALPTVPANLLLNLPKLPDELEYRLIGANMILRDVQANIIVDFIPNAIR